MAAAFPRNIRFPLPSVAAPIEATFHSLLEKAGEREGSCLWIEGESGFGKSHLLRGMLDSATAAGAVVLRAEAISSAETELAWDRILAEALPPIPFLQLIDGLGEPHSARLRSMLGMTAFDQDVEPPPRDAAEVHARAQSLIRLLETITRRAAVVLALDDFHLASAEIVRQVQFLTLNLARSPIFWIIATRPGAPGARLTRVLFDRHLLRHVRLESLRAEQMEEVLAPHIEVEDRPRLSEWLLEKAGGHPHFTRELLRGLIERRVLVSSGEQAVYTLCADPSSLPAPTTYEEAVATRLASMDAPGLAVVRALAALGGEASIDSIAAVSELGADGVRRVANDLAAEQWLDLREIALPDGEARQERARQRAPWIGDTALLSASDPLDDRVFIRAAEAIRGDPGLTRHDQLVQVAWALDRAFAVSVDTKVRAHLDAAQSAWELQRHGRGRVHIETATRLLEEAARRDGGHALESKLEAEVYSLAGRIHLAIGPFSQARDELTRAIALLREQSSSPALAATECDLGKAHQQLGDHEAALAHFDLALASTTHEAGEVERVRIHYEIAWAHYVRDDFDTALQVLTRMSGELRGSAEHAQARRVRNLLGLIHWRGGRLTQATSAFQRALKLVGKTTPRSHQATVQHNLGLVHRDRGKLEEADRAIRASVQQYRSIGDPWREAQALYNLSLVEMDRGQREEAIRLARRALRMMEMLGAPPQIEVVRSGLAAFLAEAGEVEEATAAAERALEEIRERQLATLEGVVRVGLAAARLAAGRDGDALAEALTAVESARRQHDRDAESDAELLAARALVRLHRVGEAVERLGALEESSAGTSDVIRARILIGRAGALARSDPEAAASAAAAGLALFRKIGAERAAANWTASLTEAGVAFSPAALEPVETKHRSESAKREDAEEGGTTRLLAFGPLRIVMANGRTLAPRDWDSHKARAIFCFLLFGGNRQAGVPKERILEAIWPEAPADTVEKTFHTSLGMLRKTLAPAGEAPIATIEQAGGCYSLHFTTSMIIDAEEFERAHRRAQAAESSANFLKAFAEYRSAAALYTADFLEDSFLPWTDLWRERLRLAAWDIFHRVGVLSLRAWRPTEALSWAQRLLAQDPLDERAHRLAMQAYAAVGQRKAALDQFDRCADRLKEELDASPDPETIELKRRIRAGHRRVPTRRPAQSDVDVDAPSPPGE